MLISYASFSIAVRYKRSEILHKVARKLLIIIMSDKNIVPSSLVRGWGPPQGARVRCLFFSTHPVSPLLSSSRNTLILDVSLCYCRKYPLTTCLISPSGGDLHKESSYNRISAVNNDYTRNSHQERPRLLDEEESLYPGGTK